MIKRVWVDASGPAQVIVCGDLYADGLRDSVVSCSATMTPLDVPYQGTRPSARASDTIRFDTAYWTPFRIAIPRSALGKLTRSYFSLSVQFTAECDGLSATQSIQWIPYGEHLPPTVVAKRVQFTAVDVIYDPDHARLTTRADGGAYGLMNHLLTWVVVPRTAGGPVAAAAETPAGARDEKGNIVCRYQTAIVPQNDAVIKDHQVFMPFDYLTLKRGTAHRLIIRVGLYHSACMSYCDQEVEVTIP
jgi:hypothetical protein